MVIAAENLPPKGADPERYVLFLTQTPRPMSDPFEVAYRGQKIPAILWVMTSGESGRARWQAEKACKEALGAEAKIGSIAYEEEFLQQKAYQIVAAVVRQVEAPYFPVFPTAAHVRDNLSDDEVSVLLSAYGQFRVQTGPMLSEITEEEAEVWFEFLRKGFDRVPLARCSGEALIDLIKYLVSRLSTSQTGTSSAGSPPAAPSTTTPAPEPPASPDADATLAP
jgi:hypothetical protein